MHTLFTARLFSVTALAATLLLVGCGNSDPAEGDQTVAPVTDDQAEGYQEVAGDMHAHSAKHGGELIEVGTHQYSLETLEKDGQFVVYVMDAHHENPVMVKTGDIELELDLEDGDEVELEGKAVEEKDGMASQFTFAMPEGMTTLEGQEGHFHLTINGEEFAPHLEHEGHEHKGHESHNHGEGGDHTHADHHDDDHDHDEKAKPGLPMAEKIQAGNEAADAVEEVTP